MATWLANCGEEREGDGGHAWGLGREAMAGSKASYDLLLQASSLITSHGVLRSTITVSAESLFPFERLLLFSSLTAEYI